VTVLQSCRLGRTQPIGRTTEAQREAEGPPPKTGERCAYGMHKCGRISWAGQQFLLFPVFLLSRMPCFYPSELCSMPISAAFSICRLAPPKATANPAAIEQAALTSPWTAKMLVTLHGAGVASFWIGLTDAAMAHNLTGAEDSASWCAPSVLLPERIIPSADTLMVPLSRSLYRLSRSFCLRVSGAVAPSASDNPDLSRDSTNAF
jgi:hypothetical protein